MEIIKLKLRAIDVRNRSYVVTINQKHKDVKEFGVYAQDLKDLAQWLIENYIKSVAMESTGSYWQNLYTKLQNSGIEILLVNGKFTKNIKKKLTY